MASRNTILQRLRTTVLAVSGMHADRVHIGAISPARIKDAPHVCIVQDSETSERLDGGETRRSLTVEVTVAINVDASKTTSPDEQLNTTFDAVQAALEGLMDGYRSGGTVEIESMGIESDQVDFDDLEGVVNNVKTRLRTASSRWVVKYRRALGASS